MDDLYNRCYFLYSGRLFLREPVFDVMCRQLAIAVKKESTLKQRKWPLGGLLICTSDSFAFHDSQNIFAVRAGGGSPYILVVAVYNDCLCSPSNYQPFKVWRESPSRYSISQRVRQHQHRRNWFQEAAAFTSTLTKFSLSRTMMQR
jgi:hypothetical protein